MLDKLLDVLSGGFVLSERLMAIVRECQIRHIEYASATQTRCVLIYPDLLTIF